MEFDMHFKRSSARPGKVGDAWGIKAKGYADRTVAALKYFGLLDYQGVGKGRTVVVSDEGRKYLRAQQEETKREVLKTAALRPKQIAKYWARWGADRPADAACLDDLVLTNSFSEAGARDFLKVYDATITYAKLTESDKASSPEQGNEEESEMPMHSSGQQTSSLLDRPSGSIKRPMTMHEKFSLDEGEVSFSYPADLSPESYQDMADRIGILLRGLKRRADAEAARRRSERDDVPE
jgi:hypothetical protein